MHYQTLLVTFTFATTALAKWPFVTSHSATDCSGSGAGDSVSLVSDGCSAFNPKYNNIYVNFGSGLEEYSSVSVFSDANCETFAGPNINSSMADNTPAQCIDMQAHGAKWASARITV